MSVAVNTRAGRQTSVGHDYASKALGIFRHQAQPDQAAPVLAEKCDALEIETSQKSMERREVKRVRMIAPLGRLVRLAKPDQVWRDHPVARVDKRRNHVAIQVTPGRSPCINSTGSASRGPSST